MLIRSQLQHFTLSSYVEEHNDLADNFDKWKQLKEDENVLGCHLRGVICRPISYIYFELLCL